MMDCRSPGDASLLRVLLPHHRQRDDCRLCDRRWLLPWGNGSRRSWGRLIAATGVVSAAGLFLAFAGPNGVSCPAAQIASFVARPAAPRPSSASRLRPKAQRRLLSGAQVLLVGPPLSSGHGLASHAIAAEVEHPAEELVVVEGEFAAELPPERLEALQQKFPTLNISSPSLRIINDDPPIFVLEDLLDPETCQAFLNSMRNKDGTFPERLGQSDLPGLPSFLSPLKIAVRGMPVLDWLGNPTVRWTYKSRVLLSALIIKVRKICGLDLEYGAANIKHYRQDQWLPTHIDYNHATLMAFLNDVREGGHTLFPTLGIKVKPRSGSALVWPNQPPLKHAGDRVIDGEKWILFYNWPAEQNWEYDGNFEFNDDDVSPA